VGEDEELLCGLLEDLALVELPALGIGALPLEVLGHQLFALVRGGVQLAPTVIQRMLRIIDYMKRKLSSHTDLKLPIFLDELNVSDQGF